MEPQLDRESIRHQFIDACKNDDLETVRHLFSNYLDVQKNEYSEFVFEQGVLWVAKAGSISVAKYLLAATDFKNSFKIPSLRYSSIFDAQDETPNLELLEYLCLYLEDKEELLQIKENGSFKNKEFYDFFLNTRLEKEAMEQSIQSVAKTAENSSNAKMLKI